MSATYARMGQPTPPGFGYGYGGMGAASLPPYGTAYGAPSAVGQSSFEVVRQIQAAAARVAYEVYRSAVRDRRQPKVVHALYARYVAAAQAGGLSITPPEAEAPTAAPPGDRRLRRPHHLVPVRRFTLDQTSGAPYGYGMAYGAPSAVGLSNLELVQRMQAVTAAGQAAIAAAASRGRALRTQNILPPHAINPLTRTSWTSAMMKDGSAVLLMGSEVVILKSIGVASNALTDDGQVTFRPGASMTFEPSAQGPAWYYVQYVSSMIANQGQTGEGWVPASGITVTLPSSHPGVSKHLGRTAPRGAPQTYTSAQYLKLWTDAKAAKRMPQVVAALWARYQSQLALEHAQPPPEQLVRRTAFCKGSVRGENGCLFYKEDLSAHAFAPNDLEVIRDDAKTNRNPHDGSDLVYVTVYVRRDGNITAVTGWMDPRELT